MDREKVLEVIGIYRSFLSDVPQKDFPCDWFVGNKHDVLSHCHGMLDKMDKFVAEGRMDKVFRWLGFIQGCLWSLGYFNLEELKNNSRPDTDTEEHFERGRE